MDDEENIKRYNLDHYIMRDGFKEVILIRNSIDDLVTFQDNYRPKYEKLEVNDYTEIEKLILFPTAQILYNNILTISKY